MNQLLNKTTMVAALLRAVPVGMTVIFVLAVVLMNFLARITLVSLPWLALNAGITVSWVSFLFVDIVTRHFGAKAANMLSVVAIGVNLIVCFFSVVIGRLFDHPSLDMVVGGPYHLPVLRGNAEYHPHAEELMRRIGLLQKEVQPCS